MLRAIVLEKPKKGRGEAIHEGMSMVDLVVSFLTRVTFTSSTPHQSSITESFVVCCCRSSIIAKGSSSSVILSDFGVVGPDQSSSSDGGLRISAANKWIVTLAYNTTDESSKFKKVKRIGSKKVLYAIRMCQGHMSSSRT